MIIAYINNNISLDQITDIYPNGDYKENRINKKYIMEEFKKRENGTIIPPTYAEDAEERMIEEAEPGDIVVTSTLVNFSRSHGGMLRTIRLLTEKEVRVITEFEDFDSDTDQGRALIEALPILQQYNRNRSKERITRQREGVEKAKEEGKYTTQGRKPITPGDFEKFAAYYAAFLKNDLTKTEFAARLGVSRPTLDKLIEIQKNQQKRKGGNG